MQKWFWVATVAACLAACTGTRRNPDACCETPEECLRLGTKDAVLCETGACVNFQCIDNSETGTCDSADDCMTGECLNNMCVPPDGPGPTPLFDVAYPNVWRRSVPDELSFALVLINTSSTQLSTSSLTLKSISDDHPLANVRMIVHSNLNTFIPPHQAGGLVMPVAKPIMIDSGLVPETRTDTMTDYVTYEIQDAPQGTYDINVDAVVAFDNVDVPLHFLIHMVPGPVVYADPEQGTRVKLTR